jgi:glucan phosphoethanolaminetransferase (alkaline phosphatase superfamily)
MNKWLVLIAIMAIAFVFAYTLPVTYNNPSTNNLLVSCGLFLVIMVGIYVYFKSCQSPKFQTTKIGGKEYTPVD